MEATLYKAAVIRPLTSRPANHPHKTNKTYGSLLEKTNSQATFSNELLHMHAPALANQTYIHQHCADIGCSLEDLSGEVDRNKW